MFETSTLYHVQLPQFLNRVQSQECKMRKNSSKKRKSEESSRDFHFSGNNFTAAFGEKSLCSISLTVNFSASMLNGCGHWSQARKSFVLFTVHPLSQLKHFDPSTEPWLSCCCNSFEREKGPLVKSLKAPFAYKRKAIKSLAPQCIKTFFRSLNRRKPSEDSTDPWRWKLVEIAASVASRYIHRKTFLFFFTENSSFEEIKSNFFPSFSEVEAKVQCKTSTWSNAMSRRHFQLSNVLITLSVLCLPFRSKIKIQLNMFLFPLRTLLALGSSVTKGKEKVSRLSMSSREKFKKLKLH